MGKAHKHTAGISNTKKNERQFQIIFFPGGKIFLRFQYVIHIHVLFGLFLMPNIHYIERHVYVLLNE